ncbi:hypothetical protein KBB68_03350 [Candidatus Babeliales bacterium]|nr:hypothetical protein [Candidatus Babeliales bacterium]
MDFSYFIQGYFLGFSVATTIGISGVLCLQNMMTGRVSVALISVLAAAMADASCAMSVVFGLQAGQQFLLAHQSIFGVITGLFLCGLGISKVVGALKFEPMHQENTKIVSAFFSIFFLAIVDPVTIMDFMALCMGLTLDFSVTRHAVQFVVGLFSGSLTWWSLLCCVLLYFRQSIPLYIFQKIQQVVGCGIFGFGVWTLFTHI